MRVFRGSLGQLGFADCGYQSSDTGHKKMKKQNLLHGGQKEKKPLELYMSLGFDSSFRTSKEDKPF